MPAFNDSIRTLLKKYKFTSWVAFDLIEQGHIFQKFDFLLFANFFRFLMIIISFVVELVLEDFVLALLRYFLLLFEFLVGFFKVVVNVTGVVPASAAVVLAPLGKAKPTEAVLALLASHMHAALVLLDQTRAFRARFRVGLNPGKILAITALLLLPDAHHGASRRQVILILTREAERIATFTINSVFNRVNCFFCHVLTPFGWAPLDVFVLIGHLLAVPVEIFLPIVGSILVNFVLKVLKEKGVRDFHIAP